MWYEEVIPRVRNDNLLNCNFFQVRLRWADFYTKTFFTRTIN